MCGVIAFFANTPARAEVDISAVMIVVPADSVCCQVMVPVGLFHQCRQPRGGLDLVTTEAAEFPFIKLGV